MDNLMDRVNSHLLATGKSINSLSGEIGFGRSTLSKYLSGKYDANATAIEEKLEQYLMGLGHGVGSIGLQKRTDFFQSADSASVIGVCSSCQGEMGLGIVVGKSGFGKTFTLKYYAKMPRVAYIECDDTMSTRDLVEAIERALGIPQTYGTVWKRVNGIREFLNANKGYLVIIDEADKLISKYTQKKMEILRAIFDQSSVGMVIAGEPRLEAQIKSYLARFANRVDFYASLKGLVASDVAKYLEGYECEEEAMKELVARACNNQTGCFRLLDRTLSNAIRIINGTEQRVITTTIIAQASNMMML